MVRVAGLEPARHYCQGILSPSRLPIPSHPQNKCHYFWTTLVRPAHIFSARFLGTGATYPQRFNFEVLPERSCPSSFFTLQREADSPCNDLTYLF